MLGHTNSIRGPLTEAALAKELRALVALGVIIAVLVYCNAVAHVTPHVQFGSLTKAWPQVRPGVVRGTRRAGGQALSVAHSAAM